MYSRRHSLLFSPDFEVIGPHDDGSYSLSTTTMEEADDFFGIESQEALPRRFKHYSSVRGSTIQGSEHYKAAKVPKETKFKAAMVSFQSLLMFSYIFTGECTLSKTDREKLRSQRNRQQYKQDPVKYLKILKQNRIRYFFLLMNTPSFLFS